MAVFFLRHLTCASFYRFHAKVEMDNSAGLSMRCAGASIPSSSQIRSNWNGKRSRRKRRSEHSL
jgi:hypothetical protein